jgi:NADH:ubiquinone oxidoreductase subunit 6 (subunit J)
VPSDALVAASFYAFAALAVLSAGGLVFSRSIFHSALFLVVTLGSVAGVLVSLGADFLGVVQVLVYVGAIMVLILFGIMLTPQRVDLPNVGGPGQGMAAALVAGAVLGVAGAVTTTTAWPQAGVRPLDIPTTERIGQALFTVYVLPFEVASVLLLIALIGAIVIARES